MSSSCLRSWCVHCLALLLVGGVATDGAWGGGPPADAPPEAEDILTEVVRQNSDSNAPPPSPTKHMKTARLPPRKLKVDAKSSGQVRVQLPDGQALLTPAVADGRAYVGGGFNSSEFYSISLDTGREIWGMRLSDNGPSAPAYNRGTLSFTTESCTLYVLDAASGNCLWATWLGDPLITAPSIAGDRVLVCYPASVAGGRAANPLAKCVFAARDLRTGKPLWRRWIDESIISAPVVSGDDAYLTTFAGTLYGVCLSDGEIKLARRCRGTSAPIVVKNTIYVSRRVDGLNEKMPRECVASFDRRTGEPLLASQQRPAIYLAEASLRPQLIAAAKAESDERESSAPSAETARPTSGRPAARRAPVPGDPDYVSGGAKPVDNRPDSIKLVGRTGALDLQRFDGARLTAIGGSLVNCLGDDLLSLDPKTGKERWRFSLTWENVDRGETAAMPPAAAGGRLYVATRAGQVLRVDPKDGRIDGRINLAANLSTQPVIDDGRLVVGTSSGELIVLKSSDRSLTGWNQWGGDSIRSGGGDSDAATNDPAPSISRQPLVVRDGRELADATRATLRKWGKTKPTDRNAETAKEELSGIDGELQLDTALPDSQRETLRFAVRRRLGQLKR